jgi:hypothetical protein
MFHSIFRISVPLKTPGIIKSANLFQRILILYAYFENTPKELRSSQRIREYVFNRIR